jgi:hypothetical protein
MGTVPSVRRKRGALLRYSSDPGAPPMDRNSRAAGRGRGLATISASDTHFPRPTRYEPSRRLPCLQLARSMPALRMLLEAEWPARGCSERAHSSASCVCGLFSLIPKSAPSFPNPLFFVPSCLRALWRILRLSARVFGPCIRPVSTLLTHRIHKYTIRLRGVPPVCHPEKPVAEVSRNLN